MRPLAFDTETINRAGHGEACQLIAEIPGGGVEYVNFPQSFKQIFNFLVGGKYIAFNADFDVRSITHTKFIPPAVLETLAEYDCAVWGRYKFFIIPGKYFKCWVSGVGGFEIFDLKSFFQGHSLDSAAEKFLKDTRKINFPEAIGKIMSLKKTGGELREYVYSRMDWWLTNPKTKQAAIDYACQDVKVLSMLYDVLSKSFEAAGIPDPSLFSPGSASMEIFGGILKKNKPGDEQNRLFRESYFGGRIEVSEMGNIPGPLNYYDIKSAYPFEAANLPDLSSANWREGKGDTYKPRSDIKAGCYEVNVVIPDNWNYGPFPVRGEWGKIYFPVGEFKCFIGAAGLKLIKEFKLNYELINYWEFYGGSRNKPLHKIINKLFKLRTDKLKSLAVKLLLNSGPYGKSAESRNYNQVLPPELFKHFKRMFSDNGLYGKYTNFAYAAQITERARLRLWRAAHEQGAVLLATDGIITRGELKTGSRLGDWELKGVLSRAYILGCGRYEIIYRDWQKNSKGERWKSEYHFRGFRGAADIFKKLKKFKGDKMPQYLLDGKSLKQWALSLDRSDFNVLKSIKRDIMISDDKRFWEGSRVKNIAGYFRTRKLSLPIKEII